MQTTKLAIFEQKEIRKIIHENEWYFSVVDIIEVLTGSPTPRQYWGKIKDREFIKLELSPIWVQLKMKASDGKMRLTDWIDKRSRSIAVRQDLTDEWKDRGVQFGREYAILTAEISKATFGMTPSEYKNFKGLKNENLRDHNDRFRINLQYVSRSFYNKNNEK